MLALLMGLNVCVYAINWAVPSPKMSNTATSDVPYFLYNVGKQQMLTYGAAWGTQAILDSTEVNALPYYIKETTNGYQFYSPSAGSQGYLFRESSGTSVYTDYNNHGNASCFWDIVKNNDETFTLSTAPDDPVWGKNGSQVSNDEYTFILGWNPDGQDVTKDGDLLGTNQGVYMLKKDMEGTETNWAFVLPDDYEIFKAKRLLYAAAKEAEWNNVDYTAYTSVYNGNNIAAIKAATEKLWAKIREKEGNDTMHFFALTDSSTMIFPDRFIKNWDEDEKYITLELTGDTTITIAKSHITYQGTEYQGEKPQFLSYKFNNKFNDQLYTDAEGEIDHENGIINVEVGCIGKRLTPSFQLPDGAHAYIGDVLQHSKETRLRFDTIVRYTVAYPRQYLYKAVKISDEIWSIPESKDEQWLVEKLGLTADMLSTNAPSNHGEDPVNMLDGNPETFFHSTWGEGAYTKLTWFDGAYYGDGQSEWPYLQINLPEPLYRLQFEYTTRNYSNYAPLGLILQGSNDGETWNDIQTFTIEKDGLPTGQNQTYTSPVILADQGYKYLRLQLTSAQHKNYLVFSEFALYKVEENPDYQQEEPVIISPAEYVTQFVPYGKEYDVVVDFLTDHPTTPYRVPRVDIWFGDNETWSSSMWIGRYGKNFYEDATIQINGGGVFPDLPATPMQIRGRGNSSWSNSSNSKNPYRIKFEEKQKPFGMTKGRSWVLLANKQSNSMTTNALAMKIADMVETQGCNHIIPVELYINNQYRGSYNFTEKIGFHNNSIDLEDESYATMLELDSYYDEVYKFRDGSYNLPVNIKEPDFTDPTEETSLTINDIQRAFNNLTRDMKSSPEYANFDVESVVRAMLVNDLVRNTECKHPKSWYIYNPNIEVVEPWMLGPVWDFDWAYGYEGSGQYFIRDAEIDLFDKMSGGDIGRPFFLQLLRGSEKVKKAYFLLWTEFLNSGKFDELMEYIDDYYEYVRPSFEHNAYGDAGYLWGDGTQYATTNANAKNWLTKRANYIYTHLDKYDIPDDIIDPDEDFGQPDRVNVAEIMERPVDVYTIHGILVRKQVPYGQFNAGLMPGIYIVDGKKIAIR